MVFSRPPMSPTPRGPIASAVRTSARVALWVAFAAVALTAWLLAHFSRPISPGSYALIRHEQAEIEGINYLDYPEVRLLRDYVRIDTSEPHANEVAGAEFLAAQLGAAGIRSTIERFSDRRANLWAFVDGDDPKALVLHGHLDVERAIESRGWKYPPFAGVIEGPWIYGRGMYDMKSLTIAELLATIDVARSGKRPKRSILFLQTSGEELGSDTGTRWILAEHPELVARMGTVLTEGGVVEATNPSKVKYWGIEFDQKRFVRVSVCARNLADLRALVRYLSASGKGDPVPEVAPAVRDFLASYGRSRDRTSLRELLAEPSRIPRERDRFDDLTPFLQALFRNEVWSGTPFQDDDGEWRIYVWVHVLPGSDPLTETRRLLPAWKLRGFTTGAPEVEDWGPASPLDSPEFRGIVATIQADYPEVDVGPYFLPWAMTDARFFRRAGIRTYGFSPFPVVVFDTVQIARANERMQLPAYRVGIRLYGQAVQRLTE